MVLSNRGESPLERTTRSLVEGTPVFTSDGEEIGHVAEVTAEAFRVGVSWRPDFWLDFECVAAADGGRVSLRFDRGHLDANRVAGPARLDGDGTDGPDEATTLVNTEDGLPLDERRELNLDMERHRIR